MTILAASGRVFGSHVPVLVIGAGACGLAAALSAKAAGADVLVLERDATPMGTTWMSTGLIPGAGTRQQREQGIEDSAERFAGDLLAKTRGQTDPAVVSAIARESGPAVEWLIDHCDVPLTLQTSFLFPGHTALRMHGTPNRSGAELIAALLAAAGRADIDILTKAQVTGLFAGPDGRVEGAQVARPDGTIEEVGCDALVLACSGFAGNQALVRELIPEIADAVAFTHPGNQGDALLWGQALGAAVADLHAYQGHSSLAAGHNALIPWAHIVEGGFQVDREGRRFTNDGRGYSDQAAEVAQLSPVWSVFDQRIHDLLLEFEDYREAVHAGAIKAADTADDLRRLTGLPPALKDTIAEVDEMARGLRPDPFGRDFTRKPPLRPAYYTVRVNAALFHTQGGLVIDGEGRVKKADGTRLPNLFAGGGAARGLSGPGGWGYMAGNGLVSAIVLGRLSGAAAARLALSRKYA